MTKVKCTFEECLYIKDGVCQKDEITLDSYVRYIDCGCPDADWEVEEEGEYYDFRDEQEYEERWGKG